MNRRDILKSVGLMVGGTVIGADAFLSSCSFFENTGGILTQSQIDLLEEIAETILPHTEKSPGAKEAQVGSFINRIVTDFYSANEQKVFFEALEDFKALKYTDLSQTEKEVYLNSLEEDVIENPITTYSDQETGESFKTRPAYIMIKQLSVWGYLSSEIVAKTNFNFLPIPGRYDGCVTVNNETKPMYNRRRPGAALRKVKI